MATIKGITVQIGSDTTGLQAALKDVNQHSREITSELRQVERLLKFNPHDTELLAQKQGLLAEQVDNTRKKLDTLKVAQEQVNEQFKKGEITEEQHRAFQRELIKTESQLKHYEKQLKAVNIESDSFKAAMDKVGESLEKAGKKMADIGKNLSLKVTAPIVALGAAVTKVGADFEAAMTRSTAIMGDLSDEMRKKLSDTAREIGTSTKFSATEAAEAYEFLASAGYDAERSIAALPKVAAFAQAANADLARATTLLADAQSALGLSSQDATENMENMARVSDVLVLANTLANATTEQFSEALTNKAAAALRLVNKDVEEGVAVLAALADQGVKGAAAGDQLNIVMRDLQKAAINNKDAFADANIAVYDADGNLRNLADIVGDLENRFVGMSDEQKRSELMMLGFQDRSVSAMMTLMGTSDAIREYEKALRDAGGTTDEIAQKKLQDFWTQLDLLKKKVIDIGLTLWEDLQPVLVDHVIPALESGVEKVRSLSQWFTNLEPATKKVVIAIAGIVAAIGPALIIIGKLSTGFGALMSTIGTVSAFIKTSLIPAIAGISLPAVATVAAIAALALVAYEVYRAWDEVKTALLSLWDLIKASAVQLGLNISIAFEEMKHTVLAAVASIMDKLSLLEKIPFGVGKKFAGLKDGVSDSTEASRAKLEELRKSAEENAQRISTAVEGTKVAFTDLGTKIADDVTSVGAVVKDMATETADAAEEQAEAVEEAQKEQSKAVEEETKKRTAATRASEKEQTETITEEAEKQREEREKYEEQWNRRLFDLTADRLEKLEAEYSEAIAIAKELGADTTDIEAYFEARREEIREEARSKRTVFEEGYQDKLLALTEEGAKSRLALLDEQERAALALAEELEADVTAVTQYFALLREKIIKEEADAEREAHEERERLLLSWEDRLAEATATEEELLFKKAERQVEILEEQKKKEIELAEGDLEAIKSINDFYAIAIQKVWDEHHKAINESSEKAKAERIALEEEWNERLLGVQLDETENTLRLLDKEEQEAIDRAKERIQDEEEAEAIITKIREYYAALRAETHEKKAAERVALEKKHQETIAAITGEGIKSRLELLEEEEQEAVRLAEDLEADVELVKRAFALRRQAIIDEEQEAEREAYEEKEELLKSWDDRLFEATASEEALLLNKAQKQVEIIKEQKKKEIELAEGNLEAIAAITAFWALEEEKVWEDYWKAFNATGEKAKEEYLALEEEWSERLYTLRLTEEEKRAKALEDEQQKAIDLVKERIQDEEEAEAIITKIREYYAAVRAGLQEEERRQFERTWADKLTKLTKMTAKTAEDRLKILDAEHKKVLEEAEKLGADVEAVNRYYGEKRLKLEQEIADQHLTIWQQTTKRLKTEFENAFDAIGKTVEKAMVDVGNMLLSGGSDWKQVLVTALSAIINQIVVAAVAAMGIAELVSKALSQMWNPLGWIIIGGLLIALAAIRNNLASKLRITEPVPSGGSATPTMPSGDGAPSRTGGRQISEITGPTRNILVDLLAPLAHLSAIVGPIQEIRNILDMRLPDLGGGLQFAAAAPAGGSIIFESGSIVLHSSATNADQLSGDFVNAVEKALATRLAFARRGRAGA